MIQIQQPVAWFQITECTSDDHTTTYCNMSSKHTMCKYCGTNGEKCHRVCSRRITDQAEKDAIVAKHNDLRRKVAKGLESQGIPKPYFISNVHFLAFRHQCIMERCRLLDLLFPRALYRVVYQVVHYILLTLNWDLYFSIRMQFCNRTFVFWCQQKVVYNLAWWTTLYV